jgi:methylthioribose-1-phosphate isomerase
VSLETLAWTGEALRIVDQTLLPGELRYRDCFDVPEVWQAIKELAVRGAPAIGIAGAYGVALAAHIAAPGEAASDALRAADSLATSRPTAVNLFWALDKMRAAVASHGGDDAALRAALLSLAVTIHDEDRAMCRAIGQHGLALVPEDARILTHCNAGGLATSERGTALAVIYEAHDRGRGVSVYADETRPLLQGARLTTFELAQHGVPVKVMCDNMAGSAMQRGLIDMVVVGADRIAANGDAANKIGTYPLALVAKHHGVPFYVAAPSSTFDLSLSDGGQIPIEERAAEEVTVIGERRMAPEGVGVFNPAFDVTPASLISAIITERGLIRPVCEAEVRARLG